MAVPAHDTRDHEFAVKYDIPIRWVVSPSDRILDDPKTAYAGEGNILNSSNPESGLDINGMHSSNAALRVIEWAEKSRNGKKKVKFFYFHFMLNLMFFDVGVISLNLVPSASLIAGELQAQRLAFC